MSEIPMYLDECQHGNAHIEGVNECPTCERDQLRSHLATLTRERDEARQQLDSLRETLQDLADDLCGLQPVMTMDECVAAITQHDFKLRQEPTTEKIDRYRWEWRPPQAIRAVCKMVFALGEWMRAEQRRKRAA